MNPTLVIIALIFGAVALVQMWISTAVPIAAPPSTFDHEHPSDPTTTILRTMGGRVYMKLTTQQRLTFVCATVGVTPSVTITRRRTSSVTWGSAPSTTGQAMRQTRSD